MATRDEIVKQNLEFVYGKRTNDVLDDPDKVSYRPTKAKYVDPDAITNFAGEFEFLAPTFACKVYLPEESTPYPSFEHALLASKFKNDDKRQEVRALLQIKDVKRLISKEKGKNSVLYADWTERCISIAEMLLLDKFIRNKKLKEQLMKTGRRTLIFKNDFGDLFWGVDDQQKGQNQLGKLLEKVRNVIDQGEELVVWVRHQVKLLEAEKVSLQVIVSKEGLKVDEDCQTIELKAKFFVGKSEDQCDIVAAHPTVSRVHALLVVERAQGRLQVIDLGSANGTKLNNTPLQPYEIVTLTASDVLTFGASVRQYSFVLDTSADEKRKLLLLQKIAIEQKSSASVYGGASRSAEETAINTVFVGNIAYDVTEADIKSFFAPCGEIVNLSVPKDRASGAHKGIAFVTFADFKGVMQALARDGDELAGRNVKVKKSDAKKPSTGTSGGSGGGGNRGERGDRGDRENREERDHRPRDAQHHRPDRDDYSRGDRGDRDGARENSEYGLQTQHGHYTDQADRRSPPRRESRWDNHTNSNDNTRDNTEGRDAGDRERRGDSDRNRERDRDGGRDKDRGEKSDRNDRNGRREDSRDRRSSHKTTDRDIRDDRNSGRHDRDRKRGRSDSRDRSAPSRSREQYRGRGRSRSHSGSPPRREKKQARVEDASSSQRDRRARSASVSRSPSPARRRSAQVPASPSPPRRNAASMHNASKASPSPPRRGRAASPARSVSPPRRTRAASPSPSIPAPRVLRGASSSPLRRCRPASPSPARGSPSPPRRPRASSPVASRSPSPPCRNSNNNKNNNRAPARSRSASASPPRRLHAASPSPSPSLSPPRKTNGILGRNNGSGDSPSPPRRQRSPSPTPSRRSRFN